MSTSSVDSEPGEALERFMQYARHDREFSDHTVEAYAADIHQLREYLETVGVDRPLVELSRDHLKQYLGWLRRQELSDSTVERKVSSVRSFYAFLLKREIRSDNPASDLSYRDTSRTLPTVWSEDEIEQFIEAPNDERGEVPRDRALFELMYSTGARVGEVAFLDWSDVSWDREELTVTGKGDKQRQVPLGPPAVNYLKRYYEARNPEPEDPVFVNSRGDRLTTRGIRYLVDKYQPHVPVSKPISPHVFRHSCATHMLNRGAPLPLVQKLLGHASISTTEIYTHVSTDQLKQTYDRAHPKAG
jgi:integrase/recombinase XerC